MEKYMLELCGLRRELPIIEVAPGLKIASFVILGDMELVTKVAPEIVRQLPECDIIVSAEAKGIPLVFEIARLLNKNYVVARKSIKPYMESPLVDEVESITTQKKQIMVLNGVDVERIQGKRVVLIDDVVSTGSSLAVLERLIKKAGGEVVAKAAILAEGDAAERTDLIYLGKLPIFES